MDRATLLQIFQSRLERSDYSKLQKQGRTFYQEARRQASNTQARYIFVSSLFFFFCRAEEVYASYRVYVCMFVCTYVRMFVHVYACVTCVFPFSMSSTSGFVSISVCSLYMLSAYTLGSVVVVLVAVVSRFVTADVFLTCSFILSLLFFPVCPLCLFLVSSNFLSLHTTRDVPSIAVDLVAFHPNS